MLLYRCYVVCGISCIAYSFWACSYITRKTMEDSKRLTADLQRKLDIMKK